MNNTKTEKTEKQRKSKYALKVARRRKLAQNLGVPANTPYPALWALQKQEKESTE